MKDADKRAVGQALKALMEQANYSVYRVSQDTGIARATLTRIFEGAATGEERYAQVAAFLGTSIGELLGASVVEAHEIQEEHLEILGGRLKEIAREQGITQTELAQRMGKRQSYISRLYRGRFKGLSGYRHMADVMDIDFEAMLRDVTERSCEATTPVLEDVSPHVDVRVPETSQDVLSLREDIAALSDKVDRVLALLGVPSHTVSQGPEMATVFDREGVTYGIGKDGRVFRFDVARLSWERVS